LERLLREDIDVGLHCANDLGNISVDEARLEQILVNLSTNAADAMPNGGKLTIETCNRTLDRGYADAHPGVKVGEYVQISMCDTGRGMEDETRSRIFEPFFTTKSAGEGTGLGLAMVYGIVAQSGGHIHVYSEPGQGSCFRIYFPRTYAGRSEALARQHPPAKTPSARVLLVEDQPAVRESTRRMLESLGHRVEVAINGQDALDRFGDRATSFDLLITDVVMPKLSGRQLAEKLRAAHRDLHVLFVSGYTENAIVHHGVLDAGVQYLAKPFNRHALGEKIASILSGG
jgi:CheY-like chemotaxis protein